VHIFFSGVEKGHKNVFRVPFDRLHERRPMFGHTMPKLIDSTWDLFLDLKGERGKARTLQNLFGESMMHKQQSSHNKKCQYDKVQPFAFRSTG